MRIFALTGLLLASIASAQAALPVAVSAASAPQARAAWAQDQAIIRLGALLTIHAPGQADRQVLLNWERTPHHRQVLIVRDIATNKALVNFVQDGTVSAVISPAGEVGAPVAPWQPALIALGEPLEPLVAIDWVLGTSSTVPSAERPIAQWLSPQALKQDHWRIDYLAWFPAQAGRPSLPSHLTLTRGKVKLELELAEILSFSEPPAEYEEFSLR